MAERFVTAADYAYHEIYNRIILGEIPPGERINQDAEAERLQLSRMPVREAVRRLASEGFVIITAHRGATVRPLSIEDFEDLYDLRTCLEGRAGRLGTHQIDDVGIEQMHALVPAMEQVVDAGDLAGWLDVDWEFHRILYEAANKRRLMQLIRRYRQEARRYRLLGLSFPDELSISLNDHYAILAALADRNEEKVEELIQQAIAASQLKVAEMLQRQDIHVSTEKALEEALER
jgi:DNA-binding GntR family transcriptional regulator